MTAHNVTARGRGFFRPRVNHRAATGCLFIHLSIIQSPAQPFTPLPKAGGPEWLLSADQAGHSALPGAAGDLQQTVGIGSSHYPDVLKAIFHKPLATLQA